MNKRKIYFIFVLSLRFSIVSANPNANRLFEDLLSDYNKLVRPVNNNNETLEVSFKLKLSQLLDVVCYHFFDRYQKSKGRITFIFNVKHEKNQIMTTNVWLQHVKTDT